MACNCDNVSSAIRDCPPFANKFDVVNAINALCLEGCVGELTTVALDPEASAGSATSEGFPSGIPTCCDVAFLISEAGAIYWSNDLGTTWYRFTESLLDKCSITLTVSGDINDQNNATDSGVIAALAANCVVITAAGSDGNLYMIDGSGEVGDGTPDAGEWVNLSQIPANEYDVYTSNETGNYSTTSSSFVDVDATNYSHTMTVTTGKVMVGFYASVNNNNGQLCYFNIYVDSADYFADDGMIVFNQGATGQRMPVAGVAVIDGLSTASHTFKLRFKTAGNSLTMYAGAGTATYDVHPQFWVVELT